MAVSNPQGFLLLTLPNATLTAPQYPQQRGTLSLECVTLQVPSPMDSTSPERDVWLVLRLGSFEMPIPATQAILHSRAANSYTFPTQQGPVILSLAPASNPSMAEDLETVEVILAQYGVLQHTDASTSPGGSDGDIKGRLVLVDDNNGAIVGSLADDFTLREDPNMFTEGREKDPVIIEIPDEGHQMYVQPIPFEEHGAMMKTAGLLSRGIIYATGAIASGMQTASDYYVRSATPNKEPMVFSETTRTNVKRVHKFSGQAVKVTAKTTGLIHDAVTSLADRLGGKSNAQAPPGLAPGPSGYMTPPAYPGYAPDQKLAPPGAAYRGPSPPPGGPPPPPLPPRKKPRLLNRLLLSTDLLLTTVEKSAYTLVSQASTSASQTLGHKYGQDMGNAAAMVGETVKNVHVVYVDARGVGRRALLKSATKRIVKGRMGSKEVRLTADDWHAQTEREVQESTKDGYLNFSGYFGRGKTM